MALIIVLVLIVLGVWALKLVFKASGSITRGRQRRLAVIDTLALDTRRSLILIRRDDVEHLIISNGANDVVVESGIVVPTAVAPRARNSGVGQSAANGEQDAAAQRLGLSNILRGSKGANTRKEPKIAANEGPVTRRRKPEQPGNKPSSTSLRHTGLLRPVSEMEAAFPRNAQDNIAPPNSDSDMNELQEVDAQAMVSVEEGANPVNVDAQTKPPEAARRKDEVRPSEEIRVLDAEEEASLKSS